MFDHNKYQYNTGDDMIFETGPLNDRKTIEIDLGDKPTRIGMMLSGGADSAILLYLLALVNKQHGNIHTIVPFTIARTDGSALYSTNIVNYINAEFNTNIDAPIEVGNPDLHHSEQTRSGAVDALQQHNIDFLYSGSQMTPAGIWDTAIALYPIRTGIVKNNRVISPFALVDKRYNMDLYKQFNQMKLLEITHSCTERTVGRCNLCFNCLEREWACKELNIIDPGTM